MEKRLSEIYTEYGLRTMLSEELEDVKKLEKEYDDVDKGLRYNPLCKEEIKKSITESIVYKKESIDSIKEALKEKGITDIE